MQDQTFAIVSDIDGVIQMGNSIDTRIATDTIVNLQRERVPLYLLSNAGGISEKQATQKINSKLNVSIDTKNVILSHTPLGASEMVDFYKDKVVLTAGPNQQTCGQLAEEYGYKQHISLLEFLCIYPHAAGFALEWSAPFYEYQFDPETGEEFADKKQRVKDAIKSFQTQVLTRFGQLSEESDFDTSLEQFRNDLQISAVLVWSHHLDLGLSK